MIVVNTIEENTYSHTIPLLEPQDRVLDSLAGTLAANSGSLLVVCTEDVMATVESHVTASILAAVKHWKYEDRYCQAS